MLRNEVVPKLHGPRMRILIDDESVVRDVDIIDFVAFNGFDAIVLLVRIPVTIERK